MEVKVEKRLIFLEFVSLVFITLTAIMIQFSEYNIQNYQNEIQEKSLMISRDSETIACWQNERILADIRKIIVRLGGEYTPSIGEKENCPFDEIKKLMEDYKQNKISAQDYLYSLTVFYGKKLEELQALYNTHLNEKEKLLANQPSILKIKWGLIKRIAYIVQIMAIIISAYLYISLLKST